MRQYPQHFIDKVKRVYPDYKEMQDLADKHAYFLGRYLDDCSSDSVPISTVLKANSLQELQLIASRLAEKSGLYQEWCVITSDWR